eukprot:COSAG06_NODE_19857_length_819_cov_1.952778_1_plen_63_part_00
MVDGRKRPLSVVQLHRHATQRKVRVLHRLGGVDCARRELKTREVEVQAEVQIAALYALVPGR